MFNNIFDAITLNYQIMDSEKKLTRRCWQQVSMFSSKIPQKEAAFPLKIKVTASVTC